MSASDVIISIIVFFIQCVVVVVVERMVAFKLQAVDVVALRILALLFVIRLGKDCIAYIMIGVVIIETITTVIIIIVINTIIGITFFVIIVVAGTIIIVVVVVWFCAMGGLLEVVVEVLAEVYRHNDLLDHL